MRIAFLLGESAYHVKLDRFQETENCRRAILSYWSASLVPLVDECGRALVGVIAGARGECYPPREQSGAMQRSGARRERSIGSCP